jgi:hypothetical protein
MSPNIYQKICFGFFLFLLAFWATLYFTGTQEGNYNILFVFLYGLIPFFGGIAAIVGYQKWGGLSTTLGRAILLLGLGLFFWGVGESVWSYYVFFLDVDVPYPSLADAFFAPSVFLYTTGTIYLSRVTGTRYSLKSISSKIYLTLVPIAALIITYYVIVIMGQQGELISDKQSLLKSVLDIAYPLGDAMSLAVAMVVAGFSLRYSGGVYKYDVIAILGGLALMFAADSYLSFTSTIGTAYSGDLGDLLFTLAVFGLTFGLLGFNKLRHVTPPPTYVAPTQVPAR